MTSGQNLSSEDRRALEAANREREQIVAKYRLGREEGAVIDPWEDPTFEIYAVTDRFGFIHNKRTVENISSSVLHKTRQREVERSQKWLKMTQKWEQIYPSDTVSRRVYKGIPESLRGLVWSLLLELPRIKKEQSHVYETSFPQQLPKLDLRSCCEMGHEEEWYGRGGDMKRKALRWSPDIRQIDLDVNRTYRNHLMFRERYNVKREVYISMLFSPFNPRIWNLTRYNKNIQQQALFYVLTAYSMYNTEVGYCQGMSQLAALLLMYLNEEDAFWALSALMSHQRHSMHGFFIPNFPKLSRFQAHHDTILEKLLPRVKKHLDETGLKSDLYTIKWFMQCFLDRVPFHLALRLWDIYMLEGERLLVAMSYNMLKMHQRELLRLDMEDLFQFFQGNLERDYGFSDDEVIHSLQSCMAELRRARLDLPPPPGNSLELPTRPFGLFVPPSVEQVIGRRTLESERELLRGRRAGHRMSISIPPDGGPAFVEATANHNKTTPKKGGAKTVNRPETKNGQVEMGRGEMKHQEGVNGRQTPQVYGAGVGEERSRKGSGDRKQKTAKSSHTIQSDAVAPQQYGASVRF